LYSIEKAAGHIALEIWITDNASVDGSVEYLQARFPHVNFIQNKENAGFAKANNQALKHCTGEYVLYLNPDTILPEDCLAKCLAFMQSHTQAGALGVRMIDGAGKFLPESKRSFPHPSTSLFKMLGLSRLFPKSKVFSKYALGYLDEFSNHEVDVLAGAFMLVRRDVLLQLNGFDETFFMYGEDIDLSYRIQKAGYKNYYFSETSIIHFKGESTRKGSLNYMKMFYQAMSIFVQKHYTGSKASVFRFFAQVAILTSAIISTFLKFLVRIGMPLLDAITIFASFEVVVFFWIRYVRGGEGFIESLVNVSLPGFTIVFITAAWLAGIYDNMYKPAKALYSALIATVVMLAVYSLLPERFRFSRGVILFGGLTALLFMTLLRWMLLRWRIVEDTNEMHRHYQTIVVATEAEYIEVDELMAISGLQKRLMGRVAVTEEKGATLGTIKDLETLLYGIRIKEIIFCKGYLSYSSIMEIIQSLPKNISYRFHAYGSGSIVGSDSKDALGEYVSPVGNFKLSQPYQKRMKKLVDVCTALSILITFPIHVLVLGFGCLHNAFMVLMGRRTWVGYAQPVKALPVLLPGVLTTTGISHKQQKQKPDESTTQIDLWYAKNYHWKQDVKIIIKHYRRLG
jgi:GT2 family glycosyltransferase